MKVWKTMMKRRKRKLRQRRVERGEREERRMKRNQVAANVDVEAIKALVMPNSNAK